MTEEQKELVQESMMYILPNASKIGETFYKNLFIAAPEVEPLFKNNISEQAKKLMDVVQHAVDALNHFDQLIPTLHNLGKKHAAYGAKPEHFPVVRDVLIQTYKEIIGEMFTEEMAAAWFAVLNILAATMLEGAST